MRKPIFGMLALVFALTLLAACRPGGGVTTPPVQDSHGPDGAETPPTDTILQPVDTQPPITGFAPTEEPPVTDPGEPVPTEEPPVTEPGEPMPTEEPPVAEPSESVPTEEPPVTGPEEPDGSEGPYVDTEPVPDASLQDEADALSDSPAAIPDLLTPEASGVLVKENSKAVIDYSNTEDGYVMVCYFAETSQRLKVQIAGGTATYTYNLTPGGWEVFPLSDGNGSYKITVYQNVTESKYSSVLSLSCTVTLTDEFAPYLRPNQYVNYSADSAAVAKAAELAGKIDDPLKKVEAVYDYVVGALTYDKEKAASVRSGYLPDLDQVMAAKKGICFDYAALMAAMLRSQGVPCKLVVGYAGTAYHAWINVWTEEQGWVDGVIYFDGHAWHRMDPTFASSADQSAEIMEYIGDGANYTAKYLY